LKRKPRQEERLEGGTGGRRRDLRGGAAADPSLLHLTINTGHVRRSYRSEVSDAVVSGLRPLVEEGGGPIPASPGYSVEIRREGRDAVFNILR
jgi:hypothetical protein